MSDSTLTTPITTKPAKPGRKPKPPYVPLDFTKAVAVLVWQTESGPHCEVFPDPVACGNAAAALAKKGRQCLTFGPQVQRFDPAGVQVTSFSPADAGAGASAAKS